MHIVHNLWPLVAVLALAEGISAGPLTIITSAEIDAYFGTATLLAPGGATLFTDNYLFLTDPISPDLAFDITSGAAFNASQFPIFQSHAGQFASIDPSVFVQEIRNNSCQPAGPLCNPLQPLPGLPADFNLTQALHNLPLPPGDTAVPLQDTSNVYKGFVQDVVNGFAEDGSTIIQASINMRVYEHDFIAQASPAAAAPEPSTGWLVLGTLAMALVCCRSKKRSPFDAGNRRQA